MNGDEILIKDNQGHSIADSKVSAIAADKISVGYFGYKLPESDSKSNSNSNSGTKKDTNDSNLIIKDLSIEIAAGEFVGIIGHNGCGKTTLLKSFSRILKPLGTVLVNGKETAEYKSKEFAKVLGCVSQETDAAFSFSVKDIVMMGRHPHISRIGSFGEEDLQIVNAAMEITNVFHLKDRSITEISGGERQRAFIAKTIAQQPRILLLDEPTSHLDINHQIEILNVIRSLIPTMTIIGVFHDLNIASNFCDRIIMMKAGRIVAAGTPDEVLTPEKIRESFSVEMIRIDHPITKKPYLIPKFSD